MTGSRRRVLVLSTLYPNDADRRFGTFVARSLEALAERGDWDVTVINPIGVPPMAFGRYRTLAAAAVDGSENGVAVHRPTFTLIPRFGARFNPAIIARKVLPIASAMHGARPFELVDAQFFYPDGPAAARIAETLNLPLSIKARGSDITYWGQKSFAAKKMKAAADTASGMLAVSDALKADMAAMGMPAGKIDLHRTGLDRDRFRPLDHAGLRGTLGRQLGIALPDDGPLFASVGALIPRKGQAIAIEAVAAFDDARLLLVGHGPDEADLRVLAKRLGLEDRVHFLGSVDHDLLPVVLSAADAMVLPSCAEGLANAWVEALACGTPLVICDAGGARELVSSPDAGVIVARDAAAIAAGLREVLTLDLSPRRVAKTVERFSWTGNAAALAEHYERCIAG